MSVQIVEEGLALLHEAAAKFGSIEHLAAEKIHALIAAITGDVPKLEAEAVADGKQIVADTETAVAPVEAEIKTDAKQLLDEAETDVQDAVTPPASA